MNQISLHHSVYSTVITVMSVSTVFFHKSTSLNNDIVNMKNRQNHGGEVVSGHSRKVLCRVQADFLWSVLFLCLCGFPPDMQAGEC